MAAATIVKGLEVKASTYLLPLNSPISVVLLTTSVESVKTDIGRSK
jgi:hypothetical protein